MLTASSAHAQPSLSSHPRTSMPSIFSCSKSKPRDRHPAPARAYMCFWCNKTECGFCPPVRIRYSFSFGTEICVFLPPTFLLYLSQREWQAGHLRAYVWAENQPNPPHTAQGTTRESVPCSLVGRAAGRRASGPPRSKMFDRLFEFGSDPGTMRFKAPAPLASINAAS